MKLNFAETLLVNNPARRLVQRYFEGPLLRKLGGRLDHADVLEIGCGQGMGMQVLLQQFGARRIHGIDLDLQQVRRAQNRFRREFAARTTLAVASGAQLPFRDCSFDAVVDFGVLHHIPDWQSSVSEIRRVLKPGGRFFFEEVTRAALNRWLYRKFLKHPTENRFSQHEFLSELAKQEFELLGAPRAILAKDIFIGVGQRIVTNA